MKIDICANCWAETQTLVRVDGEDVLFYLEFPFADSTSYIGLSVTAERTLCGPCRRRVLMALKVALENPRE